MLLLAVIVGVAALSFIPSVNVFGLETERVDILADLRPVEEIDAAANEEDYAADFEQLENVLASVENAADSAAVDNNARIEWIVAKENLPQRELMRSDMIKPKRASVNVPIEDYDTAAITRFDRFVERLVDGQDVRIAFLGDSFIEGDIITQDLRDQLQRTFGGRGVGFVPCAIPFDIFRKSVRRSVQGWTAYSLMNTGAIPANYRDKFFMSGYLAAGHRGSTARWQSTDLYSTIDSCTRARVLVTCRDESTIDLIINDTLKKRFDVPGADYVQELYVEAPVNSIKMSVVSGNVLCHGASLEGGRGVTVDNMSIRGNSGYTIFASGAAVNRQIDKLWGYDLVVLEYGLNGMQPGQRDFTKYQGKLCDMVAYIKRCFPNAAILILGVSDRSIKGDGGWKSINSVQYMTPFQRRAAELSGVAFWEMGKVMMAYGGMHGFVERGWAAGDHIHLNFKGGAQLAKPLADAITERAYDLLVEREGRVANMVYPLGISPEGMYPQIKLDKFELAPLIDDAE